MAKNDIAVLLEALCDRPLTGDQTGLSADVLALYLAAAKVLEQSGGTLPASMLDPIGDADKLTAGLASILSGLDAKAIRGVFDEAALRSGAVRLDALSALAFLEGIGQSPQPAPAHLVERVLASDVASSASPIALREGAAGDFSPIPAGFWTMWRGRMAAACIVLLVAGGLSWSVYWERQSPIADGGTLPPTAKSSIERPFVGKTPAEPRPALATAKPCEPPLGKDAAAEKTGRDDRLNRADARALHQECDETGTGTSEAARERTDAVRRAAGAAAEAAGRADAAQPGRDIDQSRLQADQSGPGHGPTVHDPPAATLSAPASRPNLGAVPPAASPAMRPSAIEPPR